MKEEQIMIYNVKVDVKEIKNRLVECRVRDHIVNVDQPEEFGADNSAPNPPEMLAIALGSCFVSTIQFIAIQRNIDVKNIHVIVEGDIDFSKAMGVSNKERAGFKALEVGVEFDTNLNPHEKTEFMKNVVECGASIDNILNSTPIDYKILDGKM